MKHFTAELLGTFALVFFGTGAVVVGLPAPHIALAFGLVIMCMIFALGDVSGAHLNPAVTLTFWMAGRLPGGWVGRYVAGQVAGALLASATLRGLFPAVPTLGATLPSGSVTQSLMLEIVLSFFLLFVILNVSTGAKEKGITAAIAIGSTVSLEALVGGPVSGASMNPARSLAPALVSGQLNHLWLYLTAPCLGGLLALFVHRTLFQSNET